MKKRFYLLACLSISLSAGLRAQSNIQSTRPAERVARLTPLGYRSPQAASDHTVKWVEVDLGRAYQIDSVKLYPYLPGFDVQSAGFPLKFDIRVSDDTSFRRFTMLADYTFARADYADPHDEVQVFRPDHAPSGRYVRLTATVLRNRQLALSKFEVYSGGKDRAQGRPVTDADSGELGVTLLTRAPRPQGEGDITDNPENVIPASRWKPVAYKAQAPLGGVSLHDGLFKTAMDQNVSYLLDHFSVDYLLLPFRERAGFSIDDTLPAPDPFWDVSLAGSNAGHFLMGAGNTVRWMASPELKQRMAALVDGIGACREPDGYIMGYRPETIFYSERGAYTRSWLTRGLIAAGYGGDTTAFRLLRGYYDWFDSSSYLPQLLRRAGQGVQGMIANTRMYFTPLGAPKDIQVVQRYFQEDYWLKELAAREPRAIWQYPYDHPHCYLLTSLEPYLDMYRATGEKKYLDASEGGWELFHQYWEHTGGSIAICEGDQYPPGSYYLHKETGELCCSVFWIRYNQRFHLLFPDEEKYVNEIEKSIYNIGLANQDSSRGIRYHANLLGVRETGTAQNTCCEGQGTRLYGSLPEYIYSISPDGIYIDLYAGSSIAWKHQGEEMHLNMESNFPFDPQVRILIGVARRTHAVLHIRVPSWASGKMIIRVNGKDAAMGTPGTYVKLDRDWANGDSVSFTLPAAFRLIPYRGKDAVASTGDHYAVEYGPVLMALVGRVPKDGKASLQFSKDQLIDHLVPERNHPLSFSVKGQPGLRYVPYYTVRSGEYFTCFPKLQ